MKKNLISVVMPVYNASPFLSEAVESILNQSYSNFELIAVDDASTDHSYDILKKYAAMDSRIKLFQNKNNLGVAETRNTGLRFAKGYFYAPMDADDVSHQKRLEMELDFLNSNQEHIVVGSNINIIDSDSRLVATRNYPSSWEEIRKVLVRKSPFAHSSTLIRRGGARNQIFYLERFNGSEDYEMWCRIAKIGKMSNLEETLLNYRIHSNQNTAVKLKRTLNDTISIHNIYFSYTFTTNPKDALYHLCLRYLTFAPAKFIRKVFELLEFKK